MRKIDLNLVTSEVCRLFIQSTQQLPQDVIVALQNARKKECSPLGKIVLDKIIENDELAEKKCKPLCQDTGIAVVFLTIGNQVHFDGNLMEAVNEGVRRAYCDGYLRKSVVKHPLNRVNTKDNTPAIIHVKFVEGDIFKIEIAPKGAGSENMSAIKMLTPADGIEGIKQFVLETVTKAGGKPCPPIIVGVGIGGNFEECALLSKEALLRDVNDTNPDPALGEFEEELKQLINETGIGPMGLGGSQTCLSVKVLTHPCHIASLPVAVNIQCHCARHLSCNL